MLQSVKDSSLAEWHSPLTAFLSTVVSQLHASMNLQGLTTLNQGHGVLGLQRHKCQRMGRSWLRQPALAPAWQFTSLQPAGSLLSWHSFLVCRMRVTVSVSLMLGMCCVILPCSLRAVLAGVENGQSVALRHGVYLQRPSLWSRFLRQQPPDSSWF